MTEYAPDMTRKPKRTNRLLVAFDQIILFSWKIVWLLGMLVWLIVRGAAQLIGGIWKAFGEIDTFNGIWRPFNSFFRGTGEFLRIIWWLPGWLLNTFINGMNRRPFFRSSVFVLVLATTGIWYWFYGPQPTWGKWYDYQSGIASHYDHGFYFRRTASGEWFLPGFWYTAAHKDLPFGTTVLVVNQENGRKLALRINDRGPFVDGRIIDLSRAAAKWLRVVKDGTAQVTIYTRKELNETSAPPEKISDNLMPPQKDREIPSEWVEQSEGVQLQMDLDDPVIVPSKK